MLCSCFVVIDSEATHAHTAVSAGTILQQCCYTGMSMCFDKRLFERPTESVYTQVRLQLVANSFQRVWSRLGSILPQDWDVWKM